MLLEDTNSTSMCSSMLECARISPEYNRMSCENMLGDTKTPPSDSRLAVFWVGEVRWGGEDVDASDP